ncbi:MAG TPA: PKD domain-containing protein, partial [Blastocatellia bacterium]|nr:PKD domain-containing protein [Blastocatellia bacterium]
MSGPLASGKSPASVVAPQSGGAGQTQGIAGGAVVRHAPVINSGRVEGSVRQLLGEDSALIGEDVTLSGGAVITGDLLVPGTPQVTLSGNPTFGGVVDGTGSTEPSNYQVTLNGRAQLGRLVRRIDPIPLPTVAEPPASTGTRDLIVTAAGQNLGDFATLRDLTLDGGVGMVAIPPGTYRNFTANGGGGFILGVSGSTRATIYNFASLTLNGLSKVEVVGPVVVTVGSRVTLNDAMGSSENPLWLTLKVAIGGFTLNGGALLNGIVVAPSGTLTITGNATLRGTCFSDRLIINGGGLLQGFGDTVAPAIAIDNPCQNAVTNLSELAVTGTFADNTPTTVNVNGVTASQTSGTFTATVPLNEGANTLRAVATDLFNNSSEATRSVTRRLGANQTPAVNAGPDLIVILPGTANLVGSVSDDALPTCAALTIAWTKVIGPGEVVFTNPTSPATAASFSLPGAYVLRLSAFDTELTGTDDVTVNVFPPNQAPMVDAGADQTIELPAVATLNGTVTDDGLPPGSTLTIQWSKVSGPGAVTFSSPNQPVTSAALGQPGTYVLQLSASDTEFTITDTVTVIVKPENHPPSVDAGPNQTIELPSNVVTLNGTASDDGLPEGSTLTVAWSKVSGPGAVTFTAPNQAITDATFVDPGTYVLRLSASDTRFTVTSDVTVTVIPENHAPQVSAGPDQTIELPTNTVTLNGAVTDDGLPPGSTLTIAWTTVSGPGTVTFADASAAQTMATFSAAGEYVLRLSASDTRFTSTDDVTITVIPENHAPQVNAGPDQTIELPTNTVTLNGAVTDDGLPPGSTLTIAWTTVSGPGTVTFADASAAQTTATFSAAGEYVLRLSASDTRFTSTDDVTITVIQENHAPQVNAGPDLTITLPASATLNGTVTDDGLPPGSTLTIAWSTVSGPGTVTFADASAAQTTATFSIAGTYVLRLTASDSALSASDDVTVTVQPSGPPPVAAFTVPGPPIRVLATVLSSSGPSSGSVAANLLDFNSQTVWNPPQTTNQFVTIQFSAGEQFIERVQIQAAASTIAVKNFEVLVSQTPNDADFVSVLTATYANTGTLQEFVFPGGPVRARFAKFIAKDNHGASLMQIQTFNVVTSGTHDSVVSLPSSNNVARAESPSLVVNGGRVVDSSDVFLGTFPTLILGFSNTDGWKTTSNENQFATIELAAGKVYTLDGVRLSGGVKDFEVWVSTTSTDATAFTRVLSAVNDANKVINTFLFPGGAVQARYVKYVPKTSTDGSAVLNTLFFDVIAEETGGIVGFSSVSTLFGLADRAIDNDTGTNWSTQQSQGPVNQFFKVLLSGGRSHSVYGVRIQPTAFSNPSAPKDFDIRVSMTTADDAAFTTILSGTLQNTNTLQEFLFPAPVDAKYVQFFAKNSYGAVTMGVTSFEVLEVPLDGAVLRSFTSEAGTSNAAALALDIATSNGPWTSATGQNANQSLVIQLPGDAPWLIDRAVLQPGRNIFNGDVTIATKNFDLLASTTDMNDASFTPIFSGTLTNIANLQSFLFAPVPARFLKLVLKDNYGSTSQISLNSFFGVSPQLGSTDARFVDRSTVSSGQIVSWAWDFGDGGMSTERYPAHVYAQPGVYTVKLTVTSDTGQATSTQIDYHAQSPLAADFSFSPLTPGETTPVIRFVDRSSPRFGTSPRTWTPGNGSTFTGLSISTLYTDSGTFPVTLTVGDANDARYSVTKPVVVRNVPPTVGNIQGSTLVWGQPGNITVPSITDPSSVDAAALRCEWSFGDGQGAEISLCTATKAAQTHAYAFPGLYVATLSVFDKDGGVTTVKTLNVVNRRPVAFTGVFADTALQPGSVTIKAKLLDDFAKTPLAGRTVEVRAGSATTIATSDASGNVQATLPFTAGIDTAIASLSYAGDAMYLEGGAGVELPGRPGVRRCTSDSRGIDFWLTFPPNAANGFQGTPATVHLFISGDVATTGSVSIPGIPFNAAFSVQPGVVTKIDLPNAVFLVNSDAVENRGVHVIAQAPVSVYGLELHFFASDGFTALPTATLGTDYIVLSYKNVNILNASNFGIAATADNTTVTITPAVKVGTRAAGVPYSITLNQGQAYQLVDTDNFPSDLSGTTLTSNKPIAVFGGHSGANVPNSNGFANPIFEQMLPTPSWSRGFAIMTSATRRADTVRCIASVDNTHVYVNGDLAGTIDRGQFIEQLITGPTHIIADNPIMVVQFSNSAGFDGTANSDPYMLVVPGYNQYLDRYTVATPGTNTTSFDINYVNVVAPSESVGAITLDGVPLAAASFTTIGQSGFSGAQVAVAKGSHTLAGPAPFNVSVYGYAETDAYAYPAGMCLTSQVTGVQMTLSPVIANNPTGVQDCVTATVTDLNNVPVAGVPVSFTVTGVNPATGGATTNANGEAQFCYTGNNPGSDLIRATAAGLDATATKNWGSAINQPPAVSAGPNQTITLPVNTVTLNGVASDDGLPLGSTLALTWSQVSGPAGVTFANANNAVTTATFPAAGTYVVQLLASDGQFSTASSATVVVKPAPVNQAPVVDAGPGFLFPIFEENLVLNPDNEAALVSGKIPNWTVVSGTWTQGTSATGTPVFNNTKFFAPGPTDAAELRQDIDVTSWTATINLGAQKFDFSAWVRSKDESPADAARIIIEYRDPTNSFALASLDTGAIVSTGDWALVSDKRTAPTGTGFIRIRLIAQRATGTTTDAYFDQVVLRPIDWVGVQLNGIVTDDGLPIGSTLTTNWTRQTGTRNAIIADPSQPATTAVFDTPGTGTLPNEYILRLSASDSELTASKATTIRIFPTNQSPVPSAGENQSLTLPATATLSGNVQDDNFSRVIDGILRSFPLSTSWIKISGPGTVTFSAPTQLVTTASFSAAGVYVLQLKASDTQYTATSNLTITVSAAPPVNQAPVVSAGMNQTTTQPYNTVTLNGAAADDGLPAGAVPIVSWSQVSGPAQATIAVFNALSTDVTLPVVGSYVFKLTASDGALSSFATVSVTLNPQPPANQAPVVSPGANQTITLPTTIATLNGSVQDDGLPQGSTLTIAWTQVSGPAGVTFSSPNQPITQATFPGAGVYVLQLSASDTEFTVTAQVVITVVQPPPPPSTVTVHIDSPADDAVITSPTDVIATISGGNWTLAYALNANEDINPAFTTFGSGTGALAGASAGRFDPTLLLNGTYLIRLTSLDAAGGAAIDEIVVTVRGQQKVGNFTLSFNDLTIPVAGLPIQVIRTYDSRDKRVGDFGVGWTLGIRNVRLEKSSSLGKLWDETVTPGILPKYCLEPTRAKTVTITFPDGRQYRFRAVPSPQCQLAAPITGAEMTYVQIPGDSGTSGASLTALGNNSVIIDAPVPGLVNLINLTNQQIYNPKVFRLTTAEGYSYVIDQQFGVTSMTDPNGNSLVINSNGIIHSSGKSILFTRDAAGRITKITDPAGNILTYSINPAGDLASFADREGNITNFNYNATHGLLGITDPRGIQPIRNDYDADGRLVKHTDAFGKTISYTHGIAARHEEITDRLDNVTVYEYDERGNVLRLTDALGNTTTFTYDDHDNKLSETNALGKTTSFTYDAKDNLASETDPLGNTTRFTYNDLRQVLTVTDPKGAVTTNVYDFRGNLTSTRDALGNTTSFTYNSLGLRETMTDALGRVTRYGYDGNGNLAGESDALGHVMSYAYDATGNRISQTTTRTAPGSVIETLVTTFEYDRQNRLTKTIYADGTATQTVYNSIGQQAATIDQLGRMTSFTYDSMGRLTSTAYPDTTTESSTYDAEGRRLTSTDRAGRVTSFEYDVLGRLKKTTYPDASFTSTSYDAIGRVITTTDSRGNVTSYEYDPNCGCSGRRSKITDALN